MKLEVWMLEEMWACKDQVRLFKSVFGNSAEITPENLNQAAKEGLDIFWLAWDIRYAADAFEFTVKYSQENVMTLGHSPYIYNGQWKSDCSECAMIIEDGGGIEKLLEDYSKWLNEIVRKYYTDEEV